MKNIILGFLKHFLLFVFTNVLAITIIGPLLSISGNSLKTSINNSIVIEIISFAMLSMALTIIPYTIIITIIKFIKNPPLWTYSIGGLVVLFPIFLITGNLKEVTLILIITGIICGTIYGILDKKI